LNPASGGDDCFQLHSEEHAGGFGIRLFHNPLVLSQAAALSPSVLITIFLLHFVLSQRVGMVFDTARFLEIPGFSKAQKLRESGRFLGPVDWCRSHQVAVSNRLTGSDQCIW
jgi:hypothetical protein